MAGHLRSEKKKKKSKKEREEKKHGQQKRKGREAEGRTVHSRTQTWLPLTVEHGHCYIDRSAWTYFM